MKKIIFLLLFPVFIFAQYERGYKDGYCKAHKEATSQYAPCPIVGVVPIAKVGQETYQDGFARGYNSYKASGNTSSGVGIVSDAYLIQGAKDLGKASQPVDIGKAFSDGFNNVMRYASSSINNSSNNNTSNKYTSARQTLNSAIRSAKFLKRKKKKSSKDLLKLLLKTGEIKKGDERYLKLKAEADFGYDPRTEKDPVTVAIENYRTLSDEKLYGVSDISYFDNFNSGELPLSLDEVRSRFKNEYYLYLDESGNVLFFNEIDYNSIEKGKIKYFVLSNWAGDYNGSEGYSIYYNIDSEYNPTDPFLNFVYDNTGKKVYRIDINEDFTYSINKL